MANLSDILRAERLAAGYAEHRARRERIATAALQGMLADPDHEGTPNDYADAAVRCADALIAKLDKEVKP